MQNLRPVILMSCLAVLLVLLSGGCGKKEPVAAKVGGKKIFVREIEDMVQRYVAISKKMNPAYTEPVGLKLENMRKDFLNGLIDKAVILDKAKGLGVSVSDDELVVKIEELKKANGILDEKAFSDYLKEQGISEAVFKTNIREIMLMEKTRDKFFSDITVTDAEIQSFYASHAERYTREIIQAAHILFKVPDPSGAGAGEALKRLGEQAASVVKLARSGRDFKALARQYSQDPGTRGNGGDIGTVARGDMLPELDNALFSLKKDQISEPVRTQYGFHVIKALSDPRKEMKKIDDVKADVTQALIADKRKARFQSLRDNVKIEVLWDCKNVQK